MHLDSIFDGFQKLISGSDESREQRQLPFVIEKTIHNILFIKTHMQRQDEFDAVSKSKSLPFPMSFPIPIICRYSTIVAHYKFSNQKIIDNLDEFTEEQ